MFTRRLVIARRSMALSEVVHLALSSFRSNRVSFALTSLGMVIGSAAVILVATIGLTGRQYVIHLIEGIGVNMIEVDYQGGGTSATSEQDLLTIGDETAVMEQVPGIVASSPMLETHEAVPLGQGSVKDVLVLGVSPEYEDIRNLLVVSGRFFDQQDARHRAKVADVTVPFAESLFGSADSALGKSFSMNGIPFTIIGTVQERINTFGQSEIEDQTILIPYQVGRYLTGSNSVGQIFFSVRDFGRVSEIERQIHDVIQARHRPNAVYITQDLRSLISAAGSIAGSLTIALILFSTVTLLVSGVGIMNIMLATVQARFQEIGLRKALGARQRDIQLQFLMESGLIAVSGGVIGAVLGLAPSLLINALTSYHIPISWWAVFISLSTALCIGIGFGTLPANRAASLDPVEALRHE